ncbi:MAG: transporter [Actinomycetia bacterium]|nr:transporter [Actinomycetes bacterium]
MLEEGVVSAADIDKGMRLGYGHPVGPLQLADFVGLEVAAALHEPADGVTRPADPAQRRVGRAPLRQDVYPPRPGKSERMAASSAIAAGELGATGRVIETMIPHRLDRLPWSRFHWRVVIGLGITWVLDGFEVTLVGAIASVLTKRDTLHLSTQEASSAGTAYLLGAVCGALLFGYLTDRLGRKKLFTATLAIYLVFTVASAFAWDFWSFAAFRFLAGSGIGGEYSAINSAIDELIPARVRGRVDIAINGSWWIGTATAAFLSFELLQHVRENVGWRLGFGLGAILALAIIAIRRFIPESPRWLLIHGRVEDAERVVEKIEDEVRKEHPVLAEPKGEPLVIHQLEHLSFPNIARYVIDKYPSRAVLGLALMVGQAFLYNSIFFTYTLVLSQFFGISSHRAPLFLIPFSIGNVLGPLLLGPLFDTVGRRPMITFTYVTSGVLLIITGFLFTRDVLTATTMTIAWCVIFFFASAGASSAYLTVSELFPLEARAMAIALFYAIGTGCAVASPSIFGALIATHSKTNVYYGYLVGAALMIAAGLVAAWLAVPAERRSLEEIAKPFTSAREWLTSTARGSKMCCPGP